MPTALSLLVLAAAALIVGAFVLRRRGGSRRQVLLMLLLAGILAINVAIWTLPNPRGQTLVNAAAPGR